MPFDIFACHNRFLDKILETGKTPVKIVNLDSFKEKLEVERSAVLLFNKLEQFKAFSERVIIAIESPQELHFFVYIENFKREDYASLVPRFLYSLLHNHLNFLIDFEGDDWISLMTFTTFQQPDCRAFHAVVINQFSKATKQWKNQEFSIELYRNFNGCKLVARHQRVMNHASSKLIHQAIEKSLNFKTIVVDSSDPKSTQRTDFAMSMFPSRAIPLFSKKGIEFSSTSYCRITDYVLLVSRSEPYTYWEKALLPFDEEVWYWLTGLLVFSLFVIVVTSFMSQRVRDFIFGFGVRAPVLNMM
jgi:hypothetical protein